MTMGPSLSLSVRVFSCSVSQAFTSASVFERGAGEVDVLGLGFEERGGLGGGGGEAGGQGVDFVLPRAQRAGVERLQEGVVGADFDGGRCGDAVLGEDAVTVGGIDAAPCVDRFELGELGGVLVGEGLVGGGHGGAEGGGGLFGQRLDVVGAVEEQAVVFDALCGIADVVEVVDAIAVSEQSLQAFPVGHSLLGEVGFGLPIRGVGLEGVELVEDGAEAFVAGEAAKVAEVGGLGPLGEGRLAAGALGEVFELVE